MNTRSNLAALKQLIRDTFRQAWASGICWMMLAVTAICVAALSERERLGRRVASGRRRAGAASCRTAFVPARRHPRRGEHASELDALEIDPELARREGIETISGRMSLAFGAVSVPVSRERARRRPVPGIDPGRGRRRHPRTAAGPGLDRGFRPDLPGTERGVRPARQARPRAGNCCSASTGRPGVRGVPGGALRRR